MKLTINISIDGNQVAALIGENLQEGLAGFGDTLSEALVDLAKEVRNAELGCKGYNSEVCERINSLAYLASGEH